MSTLPSCSHLSYSTLLASDWPQRVTLLTTRHPVATISPCVYTSGHRRIALRLDIRGIEHAPTFPTVNPNYGSSLLEFREMCSNRSLVCTCEMSVSGIHYSAGTHSTFHHRSQHKRRHYYEDILPSDWMRVAYMNQEHHHTDSQRHTQSFNHSSNVRHSTQIPHTVRTTRSSASAKYRRFLLFSPAIEIRPFAVIYTCASLTNALDCAVVIPVKLAPDSLNISQTTIV